MSIFSCVYLVRRLDLNRLDPNRSVATSISRTVVCFEASIPSCFYSSHRCSTALLGSRTKRTARPIGANFRTAFQISMPSRTSKAPLYILPWDTELVESMLNRISVKISTYIPSFPVSIPPPIVPPAASESIRSIFNFPAD